MLSRLESALAYAARGWKVFPIWEILPDGTCACGESCDSPGKHPRTTTGFKAASTEEAVIRTWWEKHWPDANIGIATGAGLFVIDVDPHRGGDDSIRGLPALPDTPRVSTGGGGFHAYLKGDGRNTSGLLGPGIDTRGDGGYVVAPPSNHISGRDYAWDVDYHLEDIPLADMPAWVAQKLHPQAPSAPATVPGPINNEKGARILDWSLRRVKRGVGRNETGLALACQLRDNGFSLEKAREVMALFQQKVVGLGDHQYDLDEAEHSLRQAFRKPAREPWAEGGKVYLGDGTPVPRAVPNRPVFRNTDMGNAERFIFENGEIVRYVYGWDSWHIWDGSCWREDLDGEIVRMAKGTVRRMLTDELQLLQDDDAKAELLKHAAKSEASGRIEALLKMAQSERPAPLKPADLDSDRLLLNVANGAIDLRTGDLLPHDPLLYCSRIVPAAYKPQATCPLWLAFLDRVFDGNKELTAYMQRAIGYSLTGSIDEQCMFILHGNGANGKSTFLETIKYLLAEYALSVDPKTFQEQREGIRSDLARLRGSRMIVASESESGARLSESLIKTVTGGEKIVARKLYQELEEFEPEFKLWFSTNHKPVIRNSNFGIHRRIRFIPFTVTIPAAERDKGLRNKLLNELPGILAWAIAGCVEWRKRGGLDEPAIVLEATREYTTEMDRLAMFLAEQCEEGPQFSTFLSEVFQRYRAWADLAGESVMSMKAFSLALQERGFRVVQGSDHGKPRRIFGVVLRSERTDRTDRTDFPYLSTREEKENVEKEQEKPSDPSDPSVRCPHTHFLARDGARLCASCGERVG